MAGNFIPLVWVFSQLTALSLAMDIGSTPEKAVTRNSTVKQNAVSFILGFLYILLLNRTELKIKSIRAMMTNEEPIDGVH